MVTVVVLLFCQYHKTLLDFNVYKVFVVVTAGAFAVTPPAVVVVVNVDEPVMVARAVEVDADMDMKEEQN